MLKLTVTVLAVALAGSASAAGWRSLRIDASSEVAFEQSLADFKEKLKAPRRHVFGEALKDIWIARSLAAQADDREYAAADYYRDLDGLSYKEVVEFTDPTGGTAKDTYRAALVAARFRPAAPSLNPTWNYQHERARQNPVPLGLTGGNVRGGTPLRAMQPGQ